MAQGNDKIADYGKNTQFPNNDPTKGGRKPSIRKQLEDILDSDGLLTIPKNQVIQTNKDGSVVIKVPTQQQVGMKVFSWAMSKKGNDSLKAIQMIMEQIDGKPNQNINVAGKDGQPIFNGIDLKID